MSLQSCIEFLNSEEGFQDGWLNKYDFSKGAFVNTKNPNLYQKFRNYLGESENQNPSVEDINNMKVRIALPKIGTRN